MWKKITPIAGILVLAWITLNLFNGPDSPEAGTVATNDSAVIREAEPAVAEVLETDNATAEAEPGPVEVVELDTASKDVKVVVEPAEADSTTEAASAESDYTAEAAEADAASNAVGIADSPEEGSGLDKLETVVESGTSQTDAAADTANDKSIFQMRYPSDSISGIAMYDEGEVEVIMDPEPEIGRALETAEGKDETDEKTTAQNIAKTSKQSIETTPVDVSANNALAAEGVTQTTMEMRYPTHSGTDVTFHGGGRVEVTMDVIDEPTDTEKNTEIVAKSDKIAMASTGADAPDYGRAPDDFTKISPRSAKSSPVTPYMAIRNRSADIGGISRKLGMVYGTTAIVLAKSIDETAATNELARLKSASKSLAELSEQFQSLPDYAIAPIGKVVQSQIARLRPLVDTSMSKTGVGSVLSPVLIPMMEKLGSMTR